MHFKERAKRPFAEERERAWPINQKHATEKKGKKRGATHWKKTKAQEGEEHYLGAGLWGPLLRFSPPISSGVSTSIPSLSNDHLNQS